MPSPKRHRQLLVAGHFKGHLEIHCNKLSNMLTFCHEMGRVPKACWGFTGG